MKQGPMTTLFRVRLVSLILLLFVPVATLQLFGGRPIWPPPKHSTEYRQANMLFLRFQDALASERWDEALSLCSDQVRAKAVEWPSAKAFFNETVPIDFLLAQDFGYSRMKSRMPAAPGWTENATFYGLLINLTEPNSQAPFQWKWAILKNNETWVVDFLPLKLDEYISKKKLALQLRNDAINTIRESLELRSKGIATRLIPISQPFVIGSPMLFRLETSNSGDTAVSYKAGIGHHPLIVISDKGEILASQEQPAQIFVRTQQLEGGSSAILADSIDIARNHKITKPGKYFVQFDGLGFDICVELANIPTIDPFGEKDDMFRNAVDSLTLTNRFPSEPIQIEVVATAKK
jgi:hypothetical protein